MLTLFIYRRSTRLHSTTTPHHWQYTIGTCNRPKPFQSRLLRLSFADSPSDTLATSSSAPFFSSVVFLGTFALVTNEKKGHIGRRGRAGAGLVCHLLPPSHGHVVERAPGSGHLHPGASATKLDAKFIVFTSTSSWAVELLRTCRMPNRSVAGCGGCCGDTSERCAK